MPARPLALPAARLRGLALTALLAILAPVPAAAAAMETTWKACDGIGVSEDVRIAACDALIESNRFKHHYLARALTNRGSARAEQKNYASALADFAASLRHYPDYAPTYYNRGLVSAKAMDFGKAIEDFNRTIELDPTVALFYRSRGLAFSERKEHARANADLSAAIAMEPRNTDFRRVRGFARMEAGDLKGALADMNEAVRLAPRGPMEHTLRGAVYEAMKANDKAIADFRKALLLNPDFELARAALRRLGASPPQSTELPRGT